MERLRKKLSEYNQEHLLRFWEELTDEDRHQLENDIDELDLREVTDYFGKATESSRLIGRSMLDDKVRPIDEGKIASVKTSTQEELKKYEALGLKEVAESRVAVLLMSGGQGTRLGVNYPKGMYDVGLPSGKTLFQLQAERILRLQNMAEQRYGKHGEITWYVLFACLCSVIVDLFDLLYVGRKLTEFILHDKIFLLSFRYILTSEATHEATVAYLLKHKYFGLKGSNVKAFKQGMLPCFNFDGKIILDAKHRVSKAPDGNGGLYRALKNQGILEDMERRGIRSVHAHSVDNIVVKVADPIFIGYCLHSEADCGVKVIEKTSPSEAVGVVCKARVRKPFVLYFELN